MPSISLGDHFEQFVQDQIARGRYQNASEVVRAGLRMLEDYELTIHERRTLLKAKINEAWDDPRAGRPAAEAFKRIEALHAEMTGGPSKTRA